MNKMNIKPNKKLGIFLVKLHEVSNIDLVVVSQSFRGKSLWERVDILSEVIYELFQPIEAVAITPEEWTEKKSFVVDYASTGEIIYIAS